MQRAWVIASEERHAWSTFSILLDTVMSPSQRRVFDHIHFDSEEAGRAGLEQFHADHAARWDVGQEREQDSSMFRLWHCKREISPVE